MKLNKANLVVALSNLVAASPSQFKERMEDLNKVLVSRKEEPKVAKAAIVEGGSAVIGGILQTSGEVMATIGNATSKKGVDIFEAGLDKGAQIRAKAAGQQAPSDAIVDNSEVLA